MLFACRDICDNQFNHIHLIIYFMGNDPNKLSQSGAVSITVNHPKFQNAKLIPDGKQKWLQTTVGIDQKQFQKWKNSLKSLNLDATYLLLPKKQQFDRKGLCGDSGTLKLYYQNYSYVLTEEIKSRNKRKTIFEQTQLWYLLLVLSSGQQQIKRKSRSKVGDIRPHNVFLNSEGEAKVSCTLSWPRQNTNYSKTFDNQLTYLSPEDIVRLQMGAMEDNQSFQSQVFSIGLSLLSAGMLEDFLKLYTISSKSYKFNTGEATELINEWKSNTVYSQILTAVISNLCEFKPEKRLGDDQLWKWISQFQKQIKNKQDFFIESAPPKIQQELEQIRQLFPEEQPLQQYQQPPSAFVQHQPLPTYVQPVQRFEQPPQMYIQQQLSDKSVVEHYNPPIKQQPELNQLAYRETGKPAYIESYREPIAHQQVKMPNNAYQQVVMQRSSSNQRLVKEQFVPALNVQSPRNLNPDNLAKNPPIPFRTTADPRAQSVINRFNQVQDRQPPNFLPDYPSNPRYTTPSFIQNNPQKNEFVPRQISSGDPRLANYLANSPAANETQLPPQFVGRTINQAYITKGGETKTYQQGYIPQQLSPPREQFVPIGKLDNEVSRQSNQGLSYYQEIINGKGGRIEETVYIQRPQINYNRYD